MFYIDVVLVHSSAFPWTSILLVVVFFLSVGTLRGGRVCILLCQSRQFYHKYP